MFLKRRRRRFCETRKPLPDAVLAQNVGADAAEALLLAAVCRAMATLCRIPPAMIHDTDAIPDLCGLMWDGWEPGGFIVFLEDELGAALDEKTDEGIPCPVGWRFFFWGRKGFGSFGEWALATVRHLREHGVEPGSGGASADG